jgi:hypothetical protein
MTLVNLLKLFNRLAKMETIYISILTALLLTLNWQLSTISFFKSHGFDNQKILTICAIIIVGFFYILTKIIIGKKMISKYNAYWDNNLKPHCLGCKSPLLIINPDLFKIENEKAVCPKCKIPFTFISDDGQNIKLLEAKKLLIKDIKKIKA